MGCRSSGLDEQRLPQLSSLTILKPEQGNSGGFHFKVPMHLLHLPGDFKEIPLWPEKAVKGHLRIGNQQPIPQSVHFGGSFAYKWYLK